jgi:hypothetical protein
MASPGKHDPRFQTDAGHVLQLVDHYVETLEFVRDHAPRMVSSTIEFLELTAWIWDEVLEPQLDQVGASCRSRSIDPQPVYDYIQDPSHETLARALATLQNLKMTVRLELDDVGARVGTVTVELTRREWSEFRVLRACKIVSDAPGKSDTQVAREAGVDKSILSRSKLYQRAASLARDQGVRRPRGTRDAGSGNLDGIVDDV